MEAKITINGIQLSHGQAMTVRAALIDFHAATSSQDALGEDPHGRAMCRAYNEHSGDVLEIMLKQGADNAK